LKPVQDRAHALYRVKMQSENYLDFLGMLSADYDLDFRKLPVNVKHFTGELKDLVAAAERFPEAEIGRVLAFNEALVQENPQIDRETALGVQKTNELRIILGLNP